MSLLIIVRRWALGAAMATMLAGCGSRDENELRAWINATRDGYPMSSTPGGAPAVQPPIVPAADAFAAGINPFATNRIGALPGTGAAPDAGRRPEALEAFPLDSLRMIGMLKQQHGNGVVVVGVVSVVGAAGAGDQIHHVRVGQYIGQRHGRVVRITDQEIVLREWVLDGDSDWKEEMTSLKLETSA